MECNPANSSHHELTAQQGGPGRGCAGQATGRRVRTAPCHLSAPAEHYSPVMCRSQLVQTLRKDLCPVTLVQHACPCKHPVVGQCIHATVPEHASNKAVHEAVRHAASPMRHACMHQTWLSACWCPRRSCWVQHTRCRRTERVRKSKTSVQYRHALALPYFL